MIETNGQSAASPLSSSSSSSSSVPSSSSPGYRPPCPPCPPHPPRPPRPPRPLRFPLVLLDLVVIVLMFSSSSSSFFFSFLCLVSSLCKGFYDRGVRVPNTARLYSNSAVSPCVVCTRDQQSSKPSRWFAGVRVLEELGVRKINRFFDSG